MRTLAASNLVVASNVWIDADNPDHTTPWQAMEQIPGDLMIDFVAKQHPHLNPRDRRFLADKLTPTQHQEYLNRRFFLFNGETGAAFDQS
jgi:hypothetical protein